MRHKKRFNHLGRKAAHRKAMLSNMAASLILHKRIKTTKAKAKALRMYVEPLITKAKQATTTKTEKQEATHLRRVVFSYLKQNDAVTELFREVAPKVATREGGYTRILKLGNRLGDNAEMAIIELVDYNEGMLAEAPKAAKKSRRRRSSKKETAAESNAAETVEKVAKSTSEEAKAATKEEKAPAKKKADSKKKGDDLKKIEGVGPKIATVLAEAGLDTFAKVAASTPEAIREILDAAEGNFKAHDPKTWTEQAKLAAEDKWDELKKWQDELNGGK